MVIPSTCSIPGFVSVLCHMGRGRSRLFRWDGQALAESLKSNGSLEQLSLNANEIADRGAEAPLVLGGKFATASREISSKILGQHRWLQPDLWNFAQALASGLKQNRSLKTLYLSNVKSTRWGAWFNSGAPGRQAGGGTWPNTRVALNPDVYSILPYDFIEVLMTRIVASLHYSFFIQNLK